MDAALVAMARPQQGIDNNARKGEIVEALADYNGAWTDFLWAAERVTPRNLGDLAALRRVQTKIVSMREMVDREARIVADLPPTAVVLATYQDRAEFIAGEIRPVLSAAISRIPG
jgi:hypothetical protein